MADFDWSTLDPNEKPLSETSLTARNILAGLSLAEHQGDVNGYLPWLADAMGEPRPRWSEGLSRYVWPWEEWEEREYCDPEEQENAYGWYWPWPDPE